MAGAFGAEAIVDINEADPEGEQSAPAGARVVVTAPKCDPLIAPLVFSAPIQLLAYYAARARGTDIDKPRNLAKSVTVE